MRPETEARLAESLRLTDRAVDILETRARMIGSPTQLGGKGLNAFEAELVVAISRLRDAVLVLANELTDAPDDAPPRPPDTELAEYVAFSKAGFGRGGGRG